MPALDLAADSKLRIWLRAHGIAGYTADNAEAPDWENQGQCLGYLIRPGGIGLDAGKLRHDGPGHNPYVSFDGVGDEMTFSVQWAVAPPYVPLGNNYRWSFHALVRVLGPANTAAANNSNAAILGATTNNGPHLMVISPTSSGFRFRMGMYNGTSVAIAATPDYALNTWMVVTCGWDGSNIFLYVNDDAPVTLASAGPQPSTSVPIIGRNYTTLYAQFDIVELLVFSNNATALTAAQRLSVYHYLADLGMGRGDSVGQARNVLSRTLLERSAPRITLSYQTPISEAALVAPGTLINVSHPDIPTADGKGAGDAAEARCPVAVVQTRLNPNTLLVTHEGLDMRDMGNLHLETCVPKNIQTTDYEDVLIAAKLPGVRFPNRLQLGCYQRPNDTRWARANPNTPRYEAAGLRMEPLYTNALVNPAFIDALAGTWTVAGTTVKEATPSNEPYLHDDQLSPSRLSMTRGAVGTAYAEPVWNLTGIGFAANFSDVFDIYYMTKRGAVGTPASTFAWYLKSAANKYYDATTGTWGAAGVVKWNALAESNNVLTRAKIVVKPGDTGTVLRISSNGAGGNNSDMLKVYQVGTPRLLRGSGSISPRYVPYADANGANAWPVDLTGPTGVSVIDSNYIYEPAAATIGDRLSLPNYSSAGRKFADAQGTFAMAVRLHWNSTWAEAIWATGAYAGWPNDTSTVLRLLFDPVGNDWITVVSGWTGLAGPPYYTTLNLQSVHAGGGATETGETRVTLTAGVTKLMVLRWTTNAAWGLAAKTIDLWWAGTKVGTINPADMPVSASPALGILTIGHWGGMSLRRFWCTDRVYSDEEIVARSKSAEAW